MLIIKLIGKNCVYLLKRKPEPDSDCAGTSSSPAISMSICSVPNRSKVTNYFDRNKNKFEKNINS